MYEANMTKMCCKTRYKLVMTDIMMPIMDGYEAAQAINKKQKELSMSDPTVNRIPIIAITAALNENTLQLCYNSGIITALSKPVHHDAIRDLIHDYYQGNKEF